MKKSIWHKILIVGLCALAVIGTCFYFVGAPQLRLKDYTEDYVNPDISIGSVGEISSASVITQKFTVSGSELSGIEVFFGNSQTQQLTGMVNAKVTDEAGNVLLNVPIENARLPFSTYTGFLLLEPVAITPNSTLNLTLTFSDCDVNSSPFVWVNPAVQGLGMTVNGAPYNGMLNINVLEKGSSHFALWHWAFVGALALLLTVFCLYQAKCEKTEKQNASNEFVHIFDKYRFLLSQLVGKDFKNKYRRSYLGVLWSLIGPLMMMIVVSAVFSFIFRFNIEKFPVYLILGQTMFNFFTEATNLALCSVTTSGQLIKKVYMPKYIFPLSKVMFSFVNMMFTFIPVILVMIYFKVELTVNVLYFPIYLVTFFVFTLGVGLILSAMQVFMRDTQHLYSILVTVLSYVTPIFYPANVLTPWMQILIKFNPLYHFVVYLRNILFYGVCPSVRDNIICAALAIGAFAVGMIFFYKRQNKFILYI